MKPTDIDASGTVVFPGDLPEVQPAAEASRFQEVSKICCVSTAYLPSQDLSLLDDDEIPGHFANHDEGCGSYFYVPDNESYDDDEFDQRMQAIGTYGLSARFIEILRLARAEGILYVNFDNCGGDITGMEYADAEVSE